MKLIVQIFLFLFPWKIRRILLNKVFHYQIHTTAKVGFSIICARQLIMEEKSAISSLTLCKQIDKLHLKTNARIGTLNYITGYSAFLKESFSHVLNRKCELIVGEHTAVTSRHFLDCTAGVYIGDFTTLAGIRSQIFTHSIDLKASRQDAKSVHIGNYCFVGTGCVLLKGSVLPDYSVLGAASMINKAFEESGIYGGVPAKKIAATSLQDNLYFSRKTGYVK
jgi:acetyltransferase-like isoleucine patch superfamily enzyme